MTDFEARLEAATTPEDAWRALQDLAQETVGAKLFTIMTVDMEAMLARRAYSSDPENYPAAGTKEITRNRWFDQVHGRGETFVANTLDDIDAVFPDAELIGRLGCGSVINLPITEGRTLVGTMNILHEAGYYTPARVTLTERDLSGPALRAYDRARSLGPLL
ncbi:GAF domain-containing protein [Histidinibacterium aquaticum]|uniref:GAF domain-containing protein n=1 Tax=Histidinibacterium aquaticum TaxID=2613962 RepID=A0A5J5GMF1_9RHOB|nr:GAF domain-containing protein [Histidinibacterium aquaticum]KAA9008833.1 GAF domain-containing protein [Histidinibacterium aquaticum]